MELKDVFFHDRGSELELGDLLENLSWEEEPNLVLVVFWDQKLLINHAFAVDVFVIFNCFG